jgi:hypothetical protein
MCSITRLKPSCGAKYADHNVPCDKIEPVDFIWREGVIHDAVPTDLHGRFDACIASRVIEHVPNPITCFQSLDRLLAEAGVVVQLHYNFVRIHQTLKITPAMTAGVTKKHWEMFDMVKLLEDWETVRAAA